MKYAFSHLGPNHKDYLNISNIKPRKLMKGFISKVMRVGYDATCKEKPMAGLGRKKGGGKGNILER